MMKYIVIVIILSLNLTAFGQDVNHYSQIGISSTKYIDIGIDNILVNSQNNRFRPNGMFSKGKVLSTRIKYDKPNASLEFIVPGFIIFGTCFSATNGTDCTFAHHIANILNGELGYRMNYFSISLVNGLHPYILERVQHDSGIKISLGEINELGIYVYEEDRFEAKSNKIGIQLDYTRFSKY